MKSQIRDGRLCRRISSVALAVALCGFWSGQASAADDAKPKSRSTSQGARETSLWGLILKAVSGSDVDTTEKSVEIEVVEPQPKGAKPKTKAPATHAFQRAIKLQDGENAVQTFCVDAKGQLIALLAPARRYEGTEQNVNSEIRVVTSDGSPVSDWKVDFHAHSINVGPDGNIYVAGDGNVAKFDPAGKLIDKRELPHIAELMKDTDAIRKQAEEQVRNSRQNNEGVLDRYRKRIAKLEAKPEEERSRSEKRMLTQLKKSMEAYEGESKIDTRAVDQMVTQLTSRLKIINSIAVSDQDIFIVCGESQGYGYALWRTDHDFDNAKQVMNGMRGCCGQMDVQVQGSDLIVAENCSHAFARYDREGKKLGQWGKNERNSSDAEAFGGCCNPMNVRSGANGDIFTAESEGIIKRFSSNGDFVAMIGHRPLSGGCKNVAVASSPDGKEVYFCDQPGQQIVVLAEAQTDKGAESTGDAETGDTGAGEPLSPSDTFVSPPVEAEP